MFLNKRQNVGWLTCRKRLANYCKRISEHPRRSFRRCCNATQTGNFEQIRSGHQLKLPRTKELHAWDRWATGISSVLSNGLVPVASFPWPRSRRYIVRGMKNIGRVVSSTAQIADSDDEVFENHKTGLMFEGLAFDLPRPDRSFAVFTLIAYIIYS